MFTDFRGKNKNIFFFCLLVIWQGLDLLAVHLLVNRQFLRGSKNILAVIDSGKMQYNSEGYFTGLSWTAVILSALAGGFIVFGVTKLTEMLAKELYITDSSLPAGFALAGFLAVYIVMFLVAAAADWNLYEWGCPLAAYFTGSLIWAATVKWKIEFRKGIKHNDGEGIN